MKEIIIQPNQFLNLTALGNANTRLILQNQGRDVLYVFKQPTQPTGDSPCFRLFNWQSQEVDNSAGDIWVAAQQTTVNGRPSSERYHNVGTYYIQHLGTGVGSYYINWEERP